MKLKTLTTLFFIFMLVIPIALAQPPFEGDTIVQVAAPQSGLTIEYPKYLYITQGQNFTLHTHVIKTSNGTIVTDDTTDCFLHLYDITGEHILQENMSMDSNGIDYELYIGEGNFTQVGQYAYIIQCNGSFGGGFDSGLFSVTETGETDSSRRDITYIILGLAIIMIFYIYLAAKVDTFSTSITFYGLALLEMLNICFVMYSNEFFDNFTLILQINFITNLIIGFGIGMIALIIMLIRYVNPQDPLSEDEIKWKDTKWGKPGY